MPELWPILGSFVLALEALLFFVLQELPLENIEMPAMWKFYRAVIRSAVKEFWTATDDVLTGIAILSFLAILFSRTWGTYLLTTWNGISAWWSVIPIALLVLYRLLRANYEQFAKVESEAQQLQVIEAKMSTQQTGKTTMDRDWPGDWRLMEDGFRRHSQSSARATWQCSSYGTIENWTVHGDQQYIVREVQAFCKQSGRLLIVSPLSEQLSAEVRSQQDDQNRWLYFLKEKHGLNDFTTGTETVDGKSYAVSIGTINMLAAVSVSACVECAAMTFTR